MKKYLSPLSKEVVATISRMTAGNQILEAAVLAGGIQIVLEESGAEYDQHFWVHLESASYKLPVIRTQEKTMRELLTRIRSVFASRSPQQDGHLSSEAHSCEIVYQCAWTVGLSHQSDGIVLEWAYEEQEQTASQIAVLHKLLDTVLRQGLGDVNWPVKEFSLLDHEEAEWVSCWIQGDTVPTPKRDFLFDAIKRVALQFPERYALEAENGCLRYRELMEYAEVVRLLLVERGVGPGDFVALYGVRKKETVACILGILAAHAVYVPVEPDQPEQRLNYMLRDSGAKLLLLPGKECLQFEVTIPILNVTEDRCKSGLVCGQVETLTGDEKDPGIYLIYTSGTTGNPKGVLIRNAGVQNLCSWFQDAAQLTSASKLLLLNGFGFDASVKNIFTPLLCGGTLVLGPENLFDVERILEIIVERQVTVFNSVPAILYALTELDEKNGYQVLQSLQMIVVGGEQLKARPLQAWAKQAKQISLLNVYGPTECTSVSTCASVSREDLLFEQITIGRPIANKSVILLNRTGKLCPPGVQGELYIGGVGIADGYLGQAVSREDRARFRQIEPFGWVYRSGDLGVWTADGSILFEGRKDDQVKIQGHRIELAEIERRIEAYPSAQKAVVMAVPVQTDHSVLCGFVCMDVAAEETVDPLLERKKLRAYLEQYLPEYMVPADWILLNEFPYTERGKTDRKALLKMAIDERRAETAGGQPGSQLERTLLEIERELLGRPSLRMDEHFFSAGGHSLLLFKLKARIEETLHLEIAVTELLEYTTVKQLADFFQAKQRSQLNAAEERAVKKEAYEKRAQLRRSRRGRRCME